MQGIAGKKSDDVLASFIGELNSVKHNHRSLVIITHGHIELFLNRIIDEKCKHGRKRITANNRDFPLSVKLLLLHELNYIDDKMYNVLDGFRKIMPHTRYVFPLLQEIGNY